jgi:hypothetical protein
MSSLGRQELQVYTGAPPANSQVGGIAGYINQVIRTGTAPPSRTVDLGIGAPTLYNKASFEASGANPSRTFSYYLGLGAYNQRFRYYDQFDGASLSQVWGPPLAPCNGNPTSVGYIPRSVAPSCYSPTGQDYTNGGVTEAWVLGPYVAYDDMFVSQIQARDTVANLHIGIPRKGGNRDDVQLLFDTNFLNTVGPTSTNDQGGAAFLTAIGLGPPTYADSLVFTGAPPGALLPPGYTGGGTQPYLFPDSPAGRPVRAQIDSNRRDAFVNDQSIVKLQYQRNFGTNAFMRLYGYTYYSDWLFNSPDSFRQINLAFGPAQYLLDSHTRGVSLQFADQLNPRHLMSLEGSYTTATTLREFNRTMIGGLFPPRAYSSFSVVGVLVDSANPYNGVCYNRGGAAVNCYNVSGNGINGRAAYFNLADAAAETVPAATGTCGTGPCRYLVIGNGHYGSFNQVTPRFFSGSITDEWKPSERLNVDLGLRFDQFQFIGGDTTNGGNARVFWYNAWNRQFPALQQFNITRQINTFDVWQPRIGLTFAVNPANVIRASYGRYAQAPISAFEQFNASQPNAPLVLANFVKFGVGNTPAHDVRPQISNNYDLSFEHQFKGGTSIKVTPFLRKTQDQIHNFFLDQRTMFLSGLNVGRQTVDGVELEVDKGDFTRNGWAGRLSFTYTNSYINFTKPSKGQSVIEPINATIQSYNAYTSFCGANPRDSRCGATESGVAAAPCYTTTGAPDKACAATSVANPYWNAPVQPLMDLNGNYPTYSIIPGAIGAGGYSSYGAPYVSTLILQYKQGPLAITPALQFAGGIRYGVPESTPGVIPDQCTGGLPGTVSSGDPRYAYGALGGAPYDAGACASGIVIPDPYTKRFDGIGAFVAPNQFLLHAQITYDVNKRFTLVGNFANIINSCWGGTRVPFAVNHACGYGAPPITGGGNLPIGNVYNPGNVLQPASFLPYFPTFAGYPFAMFFEARIKL